MAMRHALVAALASALLFAGMPAAAGGYGGYRGYGHGYGYSQSYGHGHRYRGHSSSFHYYSHDDALAFLAVGALIGALIARPYYQQRPTYQPRPAYARVPPRNCQPITGTGYHRGRPAVFGGTYCTGPGGQGYVVPGSEHLLGYR